MPFNKVVIKFLASTRIDFHAIMFKNKFFNIYFTLLQHPSH